MHIWHEIKFIHNTWAMLDFGCLSISRKTDLFLSSWLNWSGDLLQNPCILMPTKFVLIVFCFCLVLFIFCRNVMKTIRLMSFWVQNRTAGCKLLRMCLYAVLVLKPRKLWYAFMCVYILLCVCMSVCTWVCFILLGNSGGVVNSLDSFARHCLSPLAAFTSGAYFLHYGRWWQWICEFYTANIKGSFGGP